MSMHLTDPWIERLNRCPETSLAGLEILARAAEAEDPDAVSAAALPIVLSAIRGEYVVLARAFEGQWRAVAQFGARPALPLDLLADVLDLDQPKATSDWVAAPVAARPAQVLAVRCGSATTSRAALPLVEALAPLLAAALAAAEARREDKQRIRRLETIVEIAQAWNQTLELQPLLVAMAEAATRLLDADRASIFLWDRRTRTLVGRPALGVPGGEMRIADDRGVVGQVIRGGEPLRVDAATEPNRIDRRVDSQTGYKTRNLLCVPLRGRSGELFGAFEVINRRQGAFTAEDEAALVELARHAAMALENAQDREQLLSNSRQITEQAAEQVRLIGDSPAMQALRSIVQRVAETDLAVLVLGENGTGKEVVAQSIHYLSRRRAKPFIALNCAAIPDTLAESELFGHEKGAFTDAREARPGKFELAADGTLFLDEIGDLSLAGQAKLLRVLEERLFTRVGGSLPLATDARVLAATNQNLADMVRQKKFREDLFYRLNVVAVEIPPLRKRPEDILLLAGHFLEDFCRRARRKTPELTQSARERLQTHPWPGNVRELRNLMERIAYLSSSERVEVEDLAFIQSSRDEPAETGPARPLNDATAQFQIEYIRRAIAQAQGNMSDAAERLGLHRSNLYRKMRQLGMPTG